MYTQEPEDIDTSSGSLPTEDDTDDEDTKATYRALENIAGRKRTGRRVPATEPKPKRRALATPAAGAATAPRGGVARGAATAPRAGRGGRGSEGRGARVRPKLDYLAMARGDSV